MELFIFGRFHARVGQEHALQDAMRRIIGPSREEVGCISIQAFCSTRDARLFYMHSRWVDEEAFRIHAGLRHTVEFVDRVKPLIDHPLDVTRTHLLA